MNRSSSSVDCRTLGGVNQAIVSPAGQDACLDHFFLACYKQIEEVERMVHSRELGSGEIKAASALLEACSNRTLFICFRQDPLTNLERSRLLDILLSCRDLQFRLRVRACPESLCSA